MTRREVVRSFAVAGGAFATGCLPGLPGPDAKSPRLSARAGQPSASGTTGKSRHNMGKTEGVIYVPPQVTQQTAAPLMVFLHGAGGTVDPIIDAFIPAADAHGVILLAPFSDGETWDALFDVFGPDPARIDSALRWTFERWRIDPARIALTGFSDGASYALGIGRANGDLFSRLAAFSPGSLLNVDAIGRPKVFITHGTLDPVLSIELSRAIVPALRGFGYEVDFREFNGVHAIPIATASEFIASL